MQSIYVVNLSVDPSINFSGGTDPVPDLAIAE